ncbi:MAG: pseudouridine synthase [Chitinophagaceae bacterium]|nr:MAG: pseudouridine synthase [Chitinophagaceae bacterium]
MLSQFVSPYPQRLLGDLDFAFPEGTHALGRLDLHTEGLLLLTTNSKMTRLLFQGPVPHPRTYYVQVKGIVLPETVERLRSGVNFTIHEGKEFTSTPCEADIPDSLPFSFPSPYNYNSYITYSWLRLTLTEGKYHQVRKMVRAVGHPCVRLVRTSIDALLLGAIHPGEVREMDEKPFLEALNIDQAS